MHAISSPSFRCPALVPWLRVGLLAVLLSGATGCVRFTLKELGQPLSPRDLTLRVRTRELAGTFADSVKVIAVSRAQTTNELWAEVIRWKLGASAAAREAVLRTDPVLALAELWVLSRQMTALADGTNGLGLARTTAKARELETNVTALAEETLSPEEFQHMSSFVTEHAARFPIRDLSFEREPVAGHWRAVGTATRLTMGTTPEAIADLSSRVTLTSQQLRDEIQWRLELGTAGLDAAWKQTQETVAHLDRALERIAAAGETATPAVTAAVALAARELQAGVLPSLQRLETQWTNTLTVLRQEREAITRDLSKERAELIQAVAAQRMALMKEVERTALALTDKASLQLRGTIRDVAVYAVVFVLVLLGLPFGFGFLAGRALGRRAEKARPPT